MNLPYLAARFAIPPFVAFTALLGQAVTEAAASPTSFGVARLVTETIVGASILFTVVLFLKHLTDERKARAEAEAKRDEATKAIADDFRSDIKGIVARFESNQAQLVERFEHNQAQIMGVTREAITALVSHDATIKMLDQRQQKLEMDVYHHVNMNMDRSRSPRPAIESEQDCSE